MAKAPVILDRQIAWVGHTEERGGVTEFQVDREGMTRAEICEVLPPYRPTDKVDYNRTDLIKAIIYEAYREAEAGKDRQRKNVRGFWYERLMYTLGTVMGEPLDADNRNSIDTTINKAWGDLVEDGWLTYDDLNIYSEKEDQYHVAVLEDSPYPTAFVLVEKASLYEVLHDLADTYEIGFCCTGGQNSRAAAMAYVSKIERLGVDLTQPFTVFSFTDFDPEGWDIPLSFVDHLRLKIPGDIRLVRLGILREQLGQSVIQRQAIPYSLEAGSKSARKAKRSKYERFVEETNGGLYITDRHGDETPARVELDIYNDEQIRGKIIDGLSKHIESFPYQIRPLKEEISDRYDPAWQTLTQDVSDRVDGAYDPYHDAIREAQERLEVERAQRAPDARAKKRELYQRIQELDSIIERETADIDLKARRLSELEGRLREEARTEYEGLVWSLQNWDIPAPEDLIRHVEKNGGWKNWVDELEIENLANGAIAEAARQHRRFSWQPRYTEVRQIQNWIEERLGNEAPYLDPDGPETPPEMLIEQTLEEGRPT